MRIHAQLTIPCFGIFSAIATALRAILLLAPALQAGIKVVPPVFTPHHTVIACHQRGLHPDLHIERLEDLQN